MCAEMFVRTLHMLSVRKAGEGFFEILQKVGFVKPSFVGAVALLGSSLS